MILTIALALTACAKPDTKCDDYVAGNGPTRILAFGDSQTAGHGSETSKGCGFSYANALSLDMRASLVNMGVGGTFFVSASEYGALEKAEFQSTDRVVMFIGFNDMRHFGEDAQHLAEFSDALRAALLNVSPKVHSIAIATTLLPVNLGDEGSAAAVDAYRAAVHAVVDSLALQNVRAFDPDAVLDGNPAYFVEDMTHLNLAGQLILTRQFESVLQ